MKLRRIAPLAIVLGAIGVAAGFAPGPEDLTPMPPVLVLKPPLNASTMGFETLQNPSTTGVQVTGIEGCPGFGVARTGSDPTFPVTVNNGSGLGLVVSCPTSSTYTINRCQFLAKQNLDTVGRFTGLCVVNGTTQLTATPNPVTFGTVFAGSSMQTVLLST
ncbi:MAG: hypothetical protein H0T79_19715, partial [Deltaproteobacteria bacterium]|nr:hypothetical protein [Deltaproteobacteria bacterium]